MGRRNNLTRLEQEAIVHFLKKRCKKGRLKRGAMKKASQLFCRWPSTITNLWKSYRADNVQDNIHTVTGIKIVPLQGRPPKYFRDDILRAIKMIPMNHRTTIRGLAGILGIPHTTVHQMIQEDKHLRAHTCSLKPTLTPENCIARVDYCLAHRKELLDNEYFKDGSDTIFLDEKIFEIDKRSTRTYLLEDEEALYKTVKNKNYLPGMMYMAIITKPRYDTHKKEWFNGKIRIYPVAERVTAKRSSKHRPKGTYEWKLLTMTKKLYAKMLVDKVLPRINSCWPRWYDTAGNLVLQNVYIQQDNARPHITPEEFEYLTKDIMTPDIKIWLQFQPSNSPDLNVLDLALFRSMAKMTWKTKTKNLEELHAKVTAMWRLYPTYLIEKSYLTWMSVMNCILEADGGNFFKLPHMAKEKMRRMQILPIRIKVSDCAQWWDAVQADDTATVTTPSDENLNLKNKI